MCTTPHPVINAGWSLILMIINPVYYSATPPSFPPKQIFLDETLQSIHVFVINLMFQLVYCNVHIKAYTTEQKKDGLYSMCTYKVRSHSTEIIHEWMYMHQL